MVRLLDFVLHDWKDGAVVDPGKIGLFGFSKGGYTALALIGAAPDFGRYASGCPNAVKICDQIRGADIPALAQDARIRAAVIADPMTRLLHPIQSGRNKDSGAILARGGRNRA